MKHGNKKAIEDPVVRRIAVLLKEEGRTEKSLTDYLGLPPGTMSKWKYNDSKVYLYYIEEICAYLETTPNYLFLGEEESDDIKGLTQTENKIIRLYRSIDKRKQSCIKETLRIFAENE